MTVLEAETVGEPVDVCESKTTDVNIAEVETEAVEVAVSVDAVDSVGELVLVAVLVKVAEIDG